MSGNAWSDLVGNVLVGVGFCAIDQANRPLLALEDDEPPICGRTLTDEREADRALRFSQAAGASREISARRRLTAPCRARASPARRPSSNSY